MKLEADCPNAEYRSGKIYCKKINGNCTHQLYKPCKGWYVLPEEVSARCEHREENDE
jgi:hypothetical protein